MYVCICVHVTYIYIYKTIGYLKHENIFLWPIKVRRMPTQIIKTILQESQIDDKCFPE